MRAPLPTFTRDWPMLAALGAGLVLVAVGAGALDAAIWGIATSVALVGCGFTALGWGVFALRAGRIAAPTTTLVGVVGMLALSAVLVVTGLAPVLGVSMLPLLAADLLLVVVALGAAVAVRGERTMAARRAGAVATPGRAADGSRRTGRPESAGASVIGLAVGAVLVAALATPALAATEAGESAVPHGELHDGGHGGGHAH